MSGPFLCRFYSGFIDGLVKRYDFPRPALHFLDYLKKNEIPMFHLFPLCHCRAGCYLKKVVMDFEKRNGKNG